MGASKFYPLGITLLFIILAGAYYIHPFQETNELTFTITIPKEQTTTTPGGDVYTAVQEPGKSEPTIIKTIKEASK